jgi:hypothetical protein
MNRLMQWRTTRLIVVGCFLAVLFSCTGKSDLSGKWAGKMTLAETGKTLSDLEFNLTQKAQTVSGTMVFTKVDGGIVKLNGSRTNDELKFDTEQKRGLTVHFTGVVKSGTLITGTAVLFYSDPKIPVRQENVTMELSRI